MYIPRLVDAAIIVPTDDSEYTYEEMEGEIKAKLMALADDACTYIHGKRLVFITTLNYRGYPSLTLGT